MSADSAAQGAAQASAEAERALVDIFLGMRVYHLAAAGVSVLLDRRRYRWPLLSGVALAGVAAESAWLAWRHRLRLAPLDHTAMTADVTVGAAAFALCALAVLPDEQFTPVNWAFSMNLWTSIGSAAGLARRQAVAGTAVLAGTYALATGIRSRALRFEAVTGLLQYAAGAVIGDVVVRRLRASAVEITSLHTQAVGQAARLAEEQVRADLQQRLHRRAIATLLEVREQLVTDPPRAQKAARLESARLRRALRGEEQAPGLAAELDAAVAEATGRGLRVELIVSDAGGANSVADAATEIVAGVVRAVLTGCDAGPGDARTVLRASAGADGAVEVSLRHRGPFREPVHLEHLVAEINGHGGRMSLERPPAGGVRMAVVLTAGRAWPASSEAAP